MILKKLQILNYKNIGEAGLELSEKLNCFVGDNGEGKTNLLDAVYYLSFCRSAFTAVDSMAICHSGDFFMLDGAYEMESGDEERIYCGMKRGAKKHFKRNGKEYKRLSQHIGLVPLIFVSPADTFLIEGGSEERRRLMDVVLSQLDNTYLESLNRYNKALQQRNTLLKQDDEPDLALLEIWEEQMAHEGELIYQKRDAFVKEFTPLFEEIYQTIAQEKEQVGLHYFSHCQRGPLLEVIQRDRMKDRAVGYSLHGIHRDDLEMTLGGYGLKREGSQGQHKSYVIALKLAQFSFLKRTASATTPLLLLDDIFDKLDARRVEQIVKLVGSDAFGQIFITDTNREHLDHILRSSQCDYRIFSVKAGCITLKEDRSSEKNGQEENMSSGKEAHHVQA